MSDLYVVSRATGVGGDYSEVPLCYQVALEDAERLVDAMTTQWREWKTWLKITALESSSGVLSCQLSTVDDSRRGQARRSTLIDGLIDCDEVVVSYLIYKVSPEPPR